MGVVFELCTCTEIIALISDLRSKIDYSRIFFFKTASPFSINKKNSYRGWSTCWIYWTSNTVNKFEKGLMLCGMLRYSQEFSLDVLWKRSTIKLNETGRVLLIFLGCLGQLSPMMLFNGLSGVCYRCPEFTDCIFVFVLNLCTRSIF